MKTPVFRIRKTFRFEASHQLKYHDGKCAHLHGHSWVVNVEVKGSSLNYDGPKQGMLMDFSSLSAVFKPIIEEKLDHRHLNDTLAMESPTSELVAEWIFNQIKDLVPGLSAVEVEETCTSWCRYELE